jgi:cell division protein FtsI (penicillin-binding protein 3)
LTARRPPARDHRTTSRAPAHARARHHARRPRRIRLLATTVGVALTLLLLCVRLVLLGTGSTYAAFGAGETYQQVALPAARGTIYDRDGDLLAVSATQQDVVADDFLVTDPRAEATALAPVLGLTAARLRPELSERNGYVVLARLVSAQVAARATALSLPGISTLPDSERVTPAGQLFSPVLGIVGFAGHGLSGLEYQYDRTLSGLAGHELVPESPAGFQLPGTPTDVVDAAQGTSLVLTLDEPLQWEVTKDLTAQIEATQAASGICVIADPRTGDVLAMVDLVRGPGGSIVPAQQNLALTAVYQPGSVMKLVTISGAIQEGIITPSTELTVPYDIWLGGWQFEDADFHPTQRMPVSEILAQSSNVGTIEIAHLLGPDRLYAYLRDFGYGQYSGLDWPGESPGILGAPDSWSASSMGALPIGTGEAVTAMQVLDAYDAVANGGVFVPPRLVAATISGSGVERPVPPARTHRILDPATASELVPLLEGVVADGTGTAAQIPGYTVAGKTGTAQIPSTTGPGYQPGAWMATFVGFLPAQDPQLSGIVVLDHPTPIYGGTVSAPVFSEIMRYALRHFDVPPAAAGAGTP